LIGRRVTAIIQNTLAIEKSERGKEDPGGVLKDVPLRLLEVGAFGDLQGASSFTGWC
jgi:hypothetical protein